MPRQLVSICLFAVDVPKELSTSAKTDARDKDVRFWSRCIMLIVCPSLKTSCLLHPQDGIRPPRPAAAFCAKVYLHHADGWELGVCRPLHLRPACEAYVATSRQDPRVIDPGPELNANMPGCCTNTHLALTTKEMLAAVGGVGCCAFMIFSHNLAKQKGCEANDAHSPMTRCIDWYFWCKFNLFFYWAGRERLRQKRFWTSWRICRASQRRLMLWWQTSLPACPIFRCPLPVIQVFWIVLDQSSMVKSMIQFIVASRCFVCGSIHLDYKITICHKQLKMRAQNNVFFQVLRLFNFEFARQTKPQRHHPKSWTTIW